MYCLLALLRCDDPRHRCMRFLILAIFTIKLFKCVHGLDSEAKIVSVQSRDAVKVIPEVDPNGYILFCLCMGRFGNKLEHLLGGMAFAKALNRTLLLPPFVTYRNVKFTEYFKKEPLEDFHRVMVAEDFMELLAPTVWPVGKRYIMCWMPENAEQSCNIKQGYPFTPFWHDLGIEFDKDIVYHFTYQSMSEWNKHFPPSLYPVLAMRGAPAEFPMSVVNRPLQKYLQFADPVVEEADQYVSKFFPGQKYVGIHLRNGEDWVNACKHAEGQSRYMASPQCLEGTNKVLTLDMCYPSQETLLKKVKEAILSTNANVVFVATDKNAMVSEIKEYMKLDHPVEVYHADPWLPLVDWAILIRSDYFIGNCVSSFTSFVKRARDVDNKPSEFFGL